MQAAVSWRYKNWPFVSSGLKIAANLISWSQSGPSAGRSTSLVSCGFPSRQRRRLDAQLPRERSRHARIRYDRPRRTSTASSWSGLITKPAGPIIPSVVGRVLIKRQTSGDESPGSNPDMVASGRRGFRMPQAAVLRSELERLRRVDSGPSGLMSQRRGSADSGHSPGQRRTAQLDPN